jgi:hypothetical protein
MKRLKLVVVPEFQQAKKNLDVGNRALGSQQPPERTVPIPEKIQS